MRGRENLSCVRASSRMFRVFRTSFLLGQGVAHLQQNKSGHKSQIFHLQPPNFLRHGASVPFSSGVKRPSAPILSRTIYEVHTGYITRYAQILCGRTSSWRTQRTTGLWYQKSLASNPLSGLSWIDQRTLQPCTSPGAQRVAHPVCRGPQGPKGPRPPDPPWSQQPLPPWVPAIESSAITRGLCRIVRAQPRVKFDQRVRFMRAVF